MRAARRWVVVALAALVVLWPLLLAAGRWPRWWEWIASEQGPSTKGRLNSVFFLNRSLGWVVGTNGRIYATTDGGRSWSPRASSVTNTLFDVYFADPQRGFAVGESGRIIETADGGQTWRPQVTGVRGVFERLAFAGRTGIAVGHGGLIMRYLPDQ